MFGIPEKKTQKYSMAEVPTPDSVTFIGRVKWLVSRYMLSKIGSKRHTLNFVCPIKSPGRLITQEDPFDEFSGSNFFQRLVSFSEIGILCSSATQPSIREIVISATFSKPTPLKFGGKNYSFRSGFALKDDCGESDFWAHRRDFTQMSDITADCVKIPTLKTGEIYYVFRNVHTVLTHSFLFEKYVEQRHSAEFRISDIEPADVALANRDFDAFADDFVVDVGVILDSDELLAFKWSSISEKFDESFFNVGLA